MPKKTVRAKAPKAAPASKTTASDFIRAQPLGLKASDVVEAGKKAGFNKISSNLVYMVRSRLNAAAGAARRKPGRPPKAAAAPVAASQGSASRSDKADTQALARLMLAVGLERSENVLRTLKTLLG